MVIFKRKATSSNQPRYCEIPIAHHLMPIIITITHTDHDHQPTLPPTLCPWNQRVSRGIP
eukprot:scaffold724_cov107-Skeletonema_dohrnii-CCMP3373.AAC.3